MKHLHRLLLVAITLTIAVTYPGTLYAFDESFAIGNGVLRYRPGEGCLSPAATCGTADINIATYNVKGKSHEVGNWRSRADRVVQNIRNNSVTVVGFQELQPDQDEYIRSSLSSFKKTTWGKSDDAIMWDSNLYDQVGKGTWKTTYFSGENHEPWVKLRHKASEREFYVLNVHDPIDRGQGSAASRLANVEAHKALIKKLQTDAPVLFTGDFNQGYNKEGGSGASSDENTAYCKLTQDGFMNHVYDLWKKRKARCPNKPDPKDNMPIVDHIFVSPSVSVSDITIIENGDNQSGSDHKAFIARLQLEGSCGGFNGEVKVAQANIKFDRYFSAAANEIAQEEPDFISMNEVGRGSRAALTPEGYSFYRDESSSSQARSTAVLWNNSRWSKVDGGRVLMVADGPQQWDPGRSFTWVTLEDNSGGSISMISLHHMINPRYHGPDKPLRQKLYKEGLEKLIVKVKELNARGPVIVAGDFNSRYPDNDPWGPREILGSIGMKSTFDTMGPVATHDGGGTIDYIFSTQNMKAVSQSSKATSASDHRFLYAKLQSTSSNPNVQTSSTSPTSCICKDPSIIDANGGVAVETPDLKSFIREYVGFAVKANEDYGIPYETNIAQGYLESGAGQSVLSKKYFNFHGLKAGSTWDGPVVNLETQEEYTPGDMTTITDGFRVFRNAQAGWRGYAEFITGNDRYKEALKYPGDPYKYLQAIKDAGYATDSQYVSKVSSIIDVVIKYTKEEDLAPPSSEIKVNGSGSAITSDIRSDCSETTGSGNASDIIKVAKEELAKSPVEYDENVLKYTTGRHEAWCADFVSWVYKQAGSPFTGGNNDWQIPSVLTMQEWFKKNGHYFEVGKENPQPGDVAFYIGTQTPDGGSTSHVNIVIEVNGGKMTTIGGNESDAVKQSTRTITLGDEGLVGFGRMK